MAATVTATQLKPKPAIIATELFRVKCDFIACMEWKPQTAIHMRKVIKSRRRTFTAQQVNVLMTALLGAEQQQAGPQQRKRDLEHHADNLGESLVGIEEGHQFGSFSCVVMLLGQDYYRVRDAYTDLVRVYGQSDASLVKESLNLLSAYLSIIPGNTQRNHSYSYLLAGISQTSHSVGRPGPATR
jgi:type IV secretory pathway VirB4 component